MYIRSYLFICFLAACSGRSIAQSPDTLRLNQMSEVVVTAQFTPTDVRQTVNRVRVLDRKTIEQRSAVNLEELLQTEPNIRLSQDAVLGSSMSINGLRGENVRILVDGVPVVGRLNGSVDAGQLPLGAVQQVEIIEGAQSLLYGSEASAGVINLVSRKSQLHRLEAEANTQLESNGFKTFQGRAGLQLGKFSLQLTGNQLSFQPDADTSLGRNQLWNPKEQTAGRAVLRFVPSENMELRLSGGLFHEQVDNLGEVRRPKYKPYAFDDYYITDRSDLTLHGEGRMKNRLYWQSTLGWNRFGRIKNTYRFDMESAQNALLEGEQDTSSATGLLARFTLASDRKDRKLNFLGGIDQFTEFAEGRRIVDTAANEAGRAYNFDLGLFGALRYSVFKNLVLQGGARYTNNRLYGSAVTPSVWMLWTPGNSVQLRLSYANGFRSPGLKELYFNFIDVNHFIIGDANLRPERSDNFRGEISWEAFHNRKTHLNLTATGFYNTVRDRIILYEITATQYQYANISKWKTTGGSLGLRLAVGDWLQFRTEVVNTGFFNSYNEEDSGLPELNWSLDWVNDLRFTFARQRLGLNIWHKRTGATPYFLESDEGIIQGETAAWNMLNAALNVNLFQNRFRINTGVKNILNVNQVRSGAASEPGHSSSSTQLVHWGRTLFVSVTVNGWTKN